MSGNTVGEVSTRETLVQGRPTQVRCVEIDGQQIALGDGALKLAQLEDDWYEDVKDPRKIIEALGSHPHLSVDLFTFWQRPPQTEPAYDFHTEWEEVAALKVTSYDDWWNRQIKSRVRTTIRKSEKEGLVVKETAYDDDFVRGMTTIFNETPTRQGRKFWHYGKDFDTVKSQFARYVHREHMIGAYVGTEMVGLIMLADAGRFALLGQILSSLQHRDKGTNNALMAKAVEVCARRGFEYLVYSYWTDDSLAEFKRRCGFERMVLPRYYVPLSIKGRLALQLGAHRGLAARLPPGIKRTLKRWRASWHGTRSS